MHVQALGHVVLKVRSLQRFDALARGRHHWACSRGIQDRRFSRGVGSCAPLVRCFGGLGSSTRRNGGSSRSVHVLDPDGNEIELYVDISD